MSKSKKRNTSENGCGVILLSGTVLTILLVINVMFVRLFFGANFANLDERFFQAAQFVLPIIMIAVEYWVFDQIFNRKKMPKRDDS